MAVPEGDLRVTEIDPIQRHLFLEGIFLRYGYDFRQYSEASLNRRLNAILTARGQTNLLNVLQEVLSSNENFRTILPTLTINTTEFFRDPAFFRALRERVFPLLKTYASLRVWSAGCSSGEEILSLNILLEEEGLLSRTTVYATDISPTVLKHAREGIFDLQSMQSFAKNYAAASGLRSPSDYYTADYGLVRFHPRLLERVVFSEHNLATDSVFVEAHLVLCRNVLIYFSRELQDRAFDLFYRSLVHRGFLGIGAKESLRFSPVARHFETLDSKYNIFQMRPA
jgi:chemotaxis protein methyltransferase CheR